VVAGSPAVALADNPVGYFNHANIEEEKQDEGVPIPIVEPSEKQGGTTVISCKESDPESMESEKKTQIEGKVDTQTAEISEVDPKTPTLEKEADAIQKLEEMFLAPPIDKEKRASRRESTEVGGDKIPIVPVVGTADLMRMMFG
jgi:hypothetical protein